MKNSWRKRVVVLESDSLLYAGMKSFLTDQEHLDVIGMEVENPEEIYQAILNLKPDVIILDQNNQATNSSKLMGRLNNLPKVRTVVVNMLDNQVQISEQRQVVIQQLSDFLAVL